MRGDYALPDIGFALLPAYTGKGYAREAGMRVIQYATIPRAEGGLGYAGVFGFADQSNELSRKVCARLGLQFKGVYELEAFGRRKSAVYASSGVELRETGIKEDRIDSD
jgi:RimJ/RimL family protein N-acetyltransferase